MVREIQPALDFHSRRRLTGLRLGRYHVGPRIGAGGTAAVYLGCPTDVTQRDHIAALKVIHEHLLEEKDFVNMFLDEGHLAQRLSHPNIVRVFELGDDDGALFLTMEYLHGQPMSRLLERLQEDKQNLAVELAAWIGARIAEALEHAHTLVGDDGEPLGLVHRDVSPQNVFLTYDGEVKLIDFGIARAAGRITRTTLGRIKGKLCYMAPEQALGRAFDHRADLFALGATIYEATVGSRLFDGEDDTETLQKLLIEEVPDPTHRVESFPPTLAVILKRALATDAADRYQSAADLGRELDDFVVEWAASEPAKALSQLITALFVDEREEQAKAIALLQKRVSFHPPPDSGPPAVEIKPAAYPSDRPTLEPPLRSRRVVNMIALLTGAAALIGAVVFAASRLQPPPPALVLPPAAPIAAASFMLEVVVHPPEAEARIEVDGTAIENRRVVLARSEEPHSVVVMADGFAPARLDAVADRDQRLVVSLVRLPEPVDATPPAVSSAIPAPSPPSVPTRPAVTAPVPPPAASSAPPPAESVDPLVRDYPF